MSALLRLRLEQQRLQAQRDIDEVEGQVAAGEMDQATADELVARYRHEIAQATLQMDAVSSDTADGRHADTASETGQEPDAIDGVGRRRRIVGAALLIGTFLVVAMLASQAIQPRQEGQFATGGPESDAAVDLDSVTNDQMEAVIAANSELAEVAQMRIALANRYFEEGDFSSALEHYIEAADGELRSDQRAQALGRIGWMTYLSGRTDLAAEYLNQALLTEPGYAEAAFFLGLVELYGNDDPAAATPWLEQVAATDGIPDDIRDQVETALADARAGVTSGGTP